MSHANQLNIGSQIAVVAAGALNTVTAGAGQDNVAQNGVAIDRSGYDSGVIAFAGNANLTASQTLAITAKLQHSGDGTTWTDAPAEAQPGGVVGGGLVTTRTTTGASTWAAEFNVLLRGCKQYIRVVWTPDLNAAGTDTATVAVIAVLGGATTLPV